jgi:two-component system response regulator AlgR
MLMETPMQVLVVDDESLARTRLRALLGDCRTPAAQVAGEAGNATQAMELMRRQRFDLVLLDVRMPGADGLALAEAMRSLPMPPPVVFVTAHPNHAVQAFEVEALDYLTKPVRLERLQQALHKAMRQVEAARSAVPESNPGTLVIQDRGLVVRLPVTEVVYLKAELKYVTVRTASRSFIHDASLTELEEMYPGRFLRIHRNALVAVRCLRALERQESLDDAEGWVVRLDGVDERLSVSRRQLPAVREILTR